MKAWAASLLLAACLPGIAAGPARAEAAPGTAARYLGSWTIADARPAPWVGDRQPSGAAEWRRLVGRTVTFARTRIYGPPMLTCRKPDYRMIAVPPDMLFQGTLTDPVAQARALGFAGATIETLETGCAGWIAFHFVDPATARFALDDMIYTLRRK
ncbi:hypothetical protein [Novosphingobium album (ex Liu et al. 2023)]|uniref:Uncharacterized protein n=1 Tax=Novosphingobium album (ex Liu et al. 2023) TaxID=3031130 RepID=A0ABT5WNJ6_9SPHN|nr:hypothetical protein [Novosphingobium album (ex Liu et al. 2023)]MDE8651609.1 hypothetical protein [Novosphingobium album (ex Liu et al. 2023)]